MKRLFLYLIVTFSAVAYAAAQRSPEELSGKFVSAFFHYNPESLKLISPSAEKEQKETLARLKDVFDDGTKLGISWNTILAVSSAATLKETKAGETGKADLVILFGDSNNTKYKLTLWDCYEANGVWKLGKKVALKRQ